MSVEELDEKWRRACRADELLNRFPEPPPSIDLVSVIFKRITGTGGSLDVVVSGLATAFAVADYEASGEAKYLQLCSLIMEASRMPGANPGEALQIMQVVGQATVKLLVSAWREEAEADSLTRLGNRRSMERFVESLRAKGTAFVYVSVDADGLKAVNDGAGGHAAGDELLRKIGESIRSVATTAGGFAYRYGGDEFGLVVQTQDGAPDFALELEKARTELDVANVRFSFGAACWPVEDPDVFTVQKRADQRMYDDKKARKSRD